MSSPYPISRRSLLLADIADFFVSVRAAVRGYGTIETVKLLVGYLLGLRRDVGKAGELAEAFKRLSSSSTTATTKELSASTTSDKIDSAIESIEDVEWKNIVVIGASLAGISLTLHLKPVLQAINASQGHDNTIRYRIILIDCHSHFHHIFAFPRAVVMPEVWEDLFVPLNQFADGAAGQFVHARVTAITPDSVTLDQVVPDFGTQIPYSYLVYAAGAQHPEPGYLSSALTKDDAISRLSGHASRIAAAQKIIIIGGGPVGIEVATEIAEHYPNKEVTLVHSRTTYLQDYKPSLGRRIYDVMNSLGITQILGERIVIPTGGFPYNPSAPMVLKTTSGRQLSCDLALMCTGLTPNSHVLRTLSPDSIHQSGFVAVRPTMQIADDRYDNIFAIGDVAYSQDIKTGASAFRHSFVVVNNIKAMIQKEKQSGDSTPTPSLTQIQPSRPQIFLYLGLGVGLCQLEYNGRLYVAGTWLVQKQFSVNVGARRAWEWCGNKV